MRCGGGTPGWGGGSVAAWRHGAIGKAGLVAARGRDQQITHPLCRGAANQKVNRQVARVRLGAKGRWLKFECHSHESHKVHT